MINALLVCTSRKSFSNLDAVLAEKHIHAMCAESGNQALLIINNHHFDIIVADEALPDMSGLELAKKLVLKNPMLNIALVSDLSPKDFHEASEGMGILMQLPPSPQKTDAEKLFERLNHILSITKNTN